jgi:hypothetical protein
MKNTALQIQPELTLEQLSKTVIFLTNEIAELKTKINLQVSSEPRKRHPVGIYEASKIIKKGIGTIYNLTSKNKIPHYKNGNQLYFYEDELLAQIESGKK